MIFLRALLSITLLASLLSCSDSTSTNKLVNEAKDKFTANSPSTASRVNISPHEARTNTSISLRIMDPSLKSDRIQWMVNDSVVKDLEGYHLPASTFRKGDRVHSVITSAGNKVLSNIVTIKNTPPVITSSKLIPRVPVKSDAISVSLDSKDADHDAVSYQYHWTVNGKFAGEDSYLDTELIRGDLIIVEVIPFDGDEYGKPVRLKSTVSNSLPSVIENIPSFDGIIYRNRVVASDPDMDLLTYSLEGNPAGMTIDRFGTITWSVNPENYGLHKLRVIVDDGNGGKITIPITVEFGRKDNPEAS